MNPGKSTIVGTVILLLVALLCIRETESGFLKDAERGVSLWVASAAGSKSPPPVAPPTLVFQGGIDASQLSALDIGLFARAARKLSSSVVATTTYEFPKSEVSLEVGSEAADAPRFIAGSLLMNRAAKAGMPAIALPGLVSADWKTEEFSGSFSGFFAGSGWQGGFLNLPSRAGQVGRFPVLAKLDNLIVASFPLAALLAQFPNVDPASVTGDPASGILIGDWLLPVAQDGSLAFDVSLLGSLRRIDMDDVLVNVERIDRGGAADPSVTALFSGQTVLLGTLGASDGESGIRMDSGRQFSLVEFQGLALASLQAAMVPRKLDFPWNWLFLLASVGGGILLIRSTPRLRPWLAVLFVAFWILFALSFYGSASRVPPLISPLVVLSVAFLLAPVLNPQGPRQPAP